MFLADLAIFRYLFLLKYEGKYVHSDTKIGSKNQQNRYYFVTNQKHLRKMEVLVMWSLTLETSVTSNHNLK